MRHHGPPPDPTLPMVIRCDGGPWHAVIWHPANPAGVLPTLRVEGWSGAYRRHRIDHLGQWVYRWEPDFTVPP